MTLRYSEGFDYIKLLDPTNTARVLGALKWYSVEGLQVVSTTAFGFGRALSNSTTNAAGGSSLIGTQISEGFFGCRLYLDSNMVAAGAFTLKFIDSLTNTVQFTVKFSQYGVIQLYRGTTSDTLIGNTDEGVFFADVYFWFELGFLVDDVGGKLEVRINTVTKALYEDVDTKVSANNFIGAYRIEKAQVVTGNTFILDDVYVTDVSGSKNNGFLGNVIVRGAKPAADGDNIEWNRSNTGLANWQNASNDEVTDDLYVYSDVDDDYDLYEIDPVFTSPFIFAISLKGFYRQDDGTQMFANNVLLSDTTLVDGEVVACMSTYGSQVDIFENDPATGMGWTTSAANLIQIGPRIAGEPT